MGAGGEWAAVGVRRCHPRELPMDLLLLADPSPQMVASYLEGWGFAAEGFDEIVGAAIAQPINSRVLELMNIAVAPHWQSQGVGRQLILAVEAAATEAGILSISVGTGNSSLDQWAFYQKCGFRLVGIDHDYFLRNYAIPIFENGIQCRDMIRLSLDVSSR